MFSRMVNPKRVLMFLASARKTLHPQHHNILRNLYPQIRQARTLPQVFPSRNYCSVAEADIQENNHALNILKENEWCNETEEKLNGISDMSDGDALDALNTLIENPEKALSFFTWYKKNPSYKPSSSVYNAILRVVGRKSQITHFWKLCEEMKSHGFMMELQTFSIVMKRMQRRRRVDYIAKLFLWMVENGEEKLSVLDCYMVLHSISNSKETNIDTANTVIEAFRNGGGAMDKKVYDGLHRCLTKAGRFEEAEKLMDTMTNEGFTLDNITYGQLIFGLCNANRLEDATKIVNEMKGKGCVPDLKTWTIIIEGHCNANQTDKAFGLFSDIVKAGYSVDSKLVQVLVLHLLKKNRDMDAYNLISKTTKGQGIKPSYITYKEIIDKLSSSRMLKEACKMLDQMKEHGYPPHAQPIIKLFGKVGSVDDAHSFLKKIREDGHLPGGDCIEMVGAFCKAGRRGEADELVSRFPTEISKTPKLLRIIKGACSDKSKSEGSTEKGLNVNKDPKGGVANEDTLSGSEDSSSDEEN